MTVFLVVAAVALVVLGVTLALRSRTTITPDVAEDEEWLDRVAGAAPPDDEPTARRASRPSEMPMRRQS